MSRYMKRRLYNAYIYKEYKRPFCHSCAASEPVEWMTSTLYCRVMQHRFGVGEKPKCTEYDWSKFIMEIL